MIGRLILTYPEASRRAGGLLILAVVAAVLYSIGVSSAWIGRVLPSSTDWLKENPALGRIVSSVLIAHEHLSLRTLAGGALIMGAALLAALGTVRKKRSNHPLKPC